MRPNCCWMHRNCCWRVVADNRSYFSGLWRRVRCNRDKLSCLAGKLPRWKKTPKCWNYSLCICIACIRLHQRMTRSHSRTWEVRTGDIGDCCCCCCCWKLNCWSPMCCWRVVADNRSYFSGLWRRVRCSRDKLSCLAGKLPRLRKNPKCCWNRCNPRCNPCRILRRSCRVRTLSCAWTHLFRIFSSSILPCLMYCLCRKNDFSWLLRFPAIIVLAIRSQSYLR